MIKLNTVKTIDIKLLPPGLTHAMIILSISEERYQHRWNNTMTSYVSANTNESVSTSSGEEGYPRPLLPPSCR